MKTDEHLGVFNPLKPFLAELLQTLDRINDKLSDIEEALWRVSENTKKLSQSEYEHQ
jgi:hypothetical protein